MSRFSFLLMFAALGACQSDQKLGTFNSEPLAIITSPADGSSVVAGADVVLTGTVSDPDGPAQALGVVWIRDGSQVCPDAEVDEIGNTNCVTRFEEDGGTATLQVTDPAGGTATDTITLAVIEDEPPVVVINSPIEGMQYYRDQLIKFEGTLTDPEDDSEQLTAAWQSSLDGALALDSTPDASGSVLDFGTLSQGEHAIVLSGTDSVGNTTSDSVTIVVGPPNTKPSCEIVSPQSGTAGEQGSLVEFAAVANDVDIDADRLTVTWSSDKDGGLGSSTPTSNGEVLFLYSGLSADSHVITMTVIDEVGATCTDLISYTVGEAPTITLVEPAAGDVVKLGSLVSFIADVDDSEDSPTSLSLDWTSSLDGSFSTQGADSGGRAQFQTNSLSQGTHGITVTVTDSTGLFATAIGSIQVVANSAPSISNVSITPNPAYADDTLTCSYSGYTDPDGDPDSSRIEWSIGGAVVGSGPNLSGGFSRGDSVKCTVTPSDGTSDGSPLSANRAISNRAPSISSVSISPASPSYGDVLTCTYSGFADVDGDGDSSAFEWFINGASSGTGSTLSAGFVSGDVVKCTVTPNDGQDDGTPLSDSVTVGNSAPSISDVSISPDPATTTDSLTCTYSGFSDADGDSDASTYRWKINGVNSGTTSSLTSGFIKGDTVKCTVTPSDGTDTGNPMTATLVISNSAPSISSVAISPISPDAGDALTCSHLGYDDADFDSDQSTYEWFINGSSAGTSTTLTGGFASGDSVKCEVTPFDGEDSGTAVSASVTIGNSAPSVAMVSVTPTPAYVTDSLTCAYTGFSDPDGDGDQSTFSWFVNTVNVGVSGATLTTGFSKGDSVMCEVEPFDGTDVGTPVASASVVISNTVPVLSNVSITPSTPVASDSLTCSSTFFDADGDGNQSTYEWLINGLSAGSGLSLSTGFVKGDEVRCVVTPDDGEDVGSELDASVVIGNESPEVSNVAISPSSPVHTDTLTCTWDFYDLDGDGDQSTAEWTNGSGASLGFGPTLAGNHTVGDSVMCTVTANDGLTNGNMASDTVVIAAANSTPTVSNVAVLSDTDMDGDGLDTTAIASDTLSCAYLFTDADVGDTDQSTVEWTIGGGASLGTSATLSGVFSKDDEVTCTVTPNDGKDAGTPLSASLTIGNAVPSVASVVITPNPASELDLLTAVPSGWYDLDGDTEDYLYEWTVNGSPAGGDTATLDPIHTSVGSAVVVTVTPFDGTDYGTPVSSSQLTIRDSTLCFPGDSWLQENSLCLADFHLVGENSSDEAGTALASAGDVDGDGHADLLVASPYSSDAYQFAGKVHLVLASTLMSSPSTTLDLSAADYTFLGEAAQDGAGGSISSAGDVDGDGLADILIGASFNDTGASDAGVAYLFLGASLATSSSTTLSLSEADHIFYGETSVGYVGSSVASAGDVDGDGLDDVLVGAERAGGSSPGKTYLFLGGSLGTAKSIPVSSADYTFTGENFDDYSGSSVAGAGDVDGDDLDDILIGARQNDSGGSNAGKVYLVFGASLSTNSQISLSSADYSFVGEATNDRAGRSVAGVGDVDGDGLDDIFVGAPYSDAGGVDSGKAYLILASSLGVSSSIDLSAADYSFVGEEAYDLSSLSVAGAGDVDGDGNADLLVGAYSYDGAIIGNNDGRSYLILGASLGASPTIDLSLADFAFDAEGGDDHSGYFVSSAGDVDGDGLSDLLLGSKYNDEGAKDAGKAYVLLSQFTPDDSDSDGVVAAYDCDDSDPDLGHIDFDKDCDGVLYYLDCDDLDPNLGAIALDPDCDGLVDWPASANGLSSADYFIVPENPEDGAGHGVASAGDVDGDGLADILVGAWGYGNYTGKTYLFYGSGIGSSGTLNLSDADYVFVGEASGDKSGRSFASAGDVNGDGLDDLLFASYGNDSTGVDAGRVYLVLADNLGAGQTYYLSDADYIFDGESAGDFAGIGVSSAGDVDGDTFDDILIGAWANDDGGTNAGKAYLVLGSSLGAAQTISLASADHTFSGLVADDGLGVSVAGAGDVDGDGLDDMLLGAYGANSSGSAYLILGSNLGASQKIDLGSADYVLVGEAVGDCAGWSVSGAGDVDGDGLADLLVGAPFNDAGGTSAGKAYLVMGANLGTTQLVELASANFAFVGEESGDQAGTLVKGSGDIDGDARDDVLISAWERDSGGLSNSGRVYVSLAKTLGSTDVVDLSTASYWFDGESADDKAGVAAAIAGDVDGDGRADLLIGTSYRDEYGSDAGKAYLLFSPF